METAGFGKFCLRLIHLAGKRVGSGQVRMDEKRAYAQVERVVILLDRRPEMPEAKLRPPIISCRTARTSGRCC
jgi:hypothetical protein